MAEADIAPKVTQRTWNDIIMDELDSAADDDDVVHWYDPETPWVSYCGMPFDDPDDVDTVEEVNCPLCILIDRRLERFANNG